MVWGGRALQTVLGKSLPAEDGYGESWEVSDHPAHRSVVADGPFQGQSLRYLMERHSRELLGAAAAQHAVFPWLFKFLDVRDWLSVQVHPDEEKVRTLWPGEGPKNEAWFVLAAEPGSKIYAGLLPGVGAKELRAALEQGTVAECLHGFEPRPGDCLFLPAGTVHAVGGGVLLAEIQQTSDATFRLFDWNRKGAQGNARKLHVEEALASIHWKQGAVRVAHVAGGSRVKVRQELVSCPYFLLEHVQTQDPIMLGGTGRLQALMVFSGEGEWESGERIVPGQVWLLPAAMAVSACRPESVLAGMLCTMPETSEVSKTSEV